jgi:hypothetical protein
MGSADDKLGADRFFVRGTALRLEADVKGAIDREAYVTVRRDAAYALPVPLGTYRAVLHFPTDRPCEVLFEGQRVLPERPAGTHPARGDLAEIEGTVADGTLDVEVRGETALLSALEIQALETEGAAAPRALPVGRPARPREGEARIPSDPGSAQASVTLEAPEFVHGVPGVEHKATRWQVRASWETYESPHLLDVVSEQDLTRRVLQEESLLPLTRYRWRVTHVGSHGEESLPGEESSFSTGSRGWDVLHFDLGPYFNRDVVAAAGETDFNGSLDSSGSQFLERGFDGKENMDPSVVGLPLDRVVGLHFLGSYGRPNALQLSQEDKAPVRLEIPADAYSEVRFLVAGGNGDSSMPVMLEFETGPQGRGVVPCDDWFDDAGPNDPVGTLRPGVKPLLDGMDRLQDGQLHRAKDAALFEVVLPADARRTLEAIVLLPGEATFQSPETRFNLLAVTGVRRGE